MESGNACKRRNGGNVSAEAPESKRTRLSSPAIMPLSPPSLPSPLSLLPMLPPAAIPPVALPEASSGDFLFVCFTTEENNVRLVHVVQREEVEPLVWQWLLLGVSGRHIFPLHSYTKADWKEYPSVTEEMLTAVARWWNKIEDSEHPVVLHSDIFNPSGHCCGITIISDYE